MTSRRTNAQRQHLIQSADSLIYHLIILSFFLSPSLLPLLSRVLAQGQSKRAGDVNRPMWATLAWLGFLNGFTVYTHLVEGAGMGGRRVILDFIGMAYTPSKPQLLLLDTTILVLQWILVGIACEISVSTPNNDDEEVPILPLTTPRTPTPFQATLKAAPPLDEYIVDLTMAGFLRLLGSRGSGSSTSTSPPPTVSGRRMWNLSLLRPD